MEAPEYYENVRVADVLARDADHVATMLTAAKSIERGVHTVAAVERVYTARRLAHELISELEQLRSELQADSNAARARNAEARDGAAA